MAKLTHAILIEGGSGTLREQKAIALLKEHFADDSAAAWKLDRGAFEDLIVLEPEEGKEITKDRIEYLGEVFIQKPFASTGKACIIRNGESMNETAQNKLLKLLEEPVAGDVILILTANAEGLLPTVRSRCMRFWLGYAAPEQGPLSEDLRGLTSALIYEKGAFAVASGILSRYEGSREEAVAFLSAFQLFLRNLLVGRFSGGLIAAGDGEAEWLRESALKVRQKHADRMQKCVLLAESALRDIERDRGVRVRYALRGMALSMRFEG